MTTYADTSYLVSLYTFDSNTADAIANDQQASDSPLLTEFGRFELKNAVRLKVFRREITSQQAEASLADLERDISAGAIAIMQCDWSMVLAKAEDLPTSSRFNPDIVAWMFYMWLRQFSSVRRIF